MGLQARMPREVDLTIQDALAKLKELECNSNESLDIVLALPEVTIVVTKRVWMKIISPKVELIFLMHQVKLNCITVLPRLCLQQKNTARKDVKNIMIQRGAVMVQFSLLFQRLKNATI